MKREKETNYQETDEEIKVRLQQAKDEEEKLELQRKANENLKCWAKEQLRKKEAKDE